MISSKNTVVLYPIATIDTLEQSGFKYSTPSFSYQSENDLLNIELNEEFDNTLFIHEVDPNWDPNHNNLIIKQELTFENPTVFFGEDGVTHKENKIGIAVHIHSRTTNYQAKKKIGHIENKENPVTFSFVHEFEKDILRGEMYLEFFLYLEEMNISTPLQADKKGLRLSEDLMPPLVILVDGIGSIFPILEIHDKGAPLWQVEKNWADPLDDPFDISTVHLRLNVAHSEFKRLKEEKTSLSRLYMGDIMIQVMSGVINDVVNNSNYVLSDAENAAPDSIIAVVKYWVDTFEVNTTDYFSIINSLKIKLEDSFR